MNKMLFKSILFSATVGMALAANASLNLAVGTGFSAPDVCGITNIGSQQNGDIVYDHCSSTFYGYGGSTAGWLSLGGAGTTPKAPVVTKYTSAGTGSYATPTSPAPLYIKVRMVGGGGGGAGSGTGTPGSGGLGGDSTFQVTAGPTLLVAGGGHGGVAGNGSGGGAGGVASLGTGPTGLIFTGASGSMSYNGTVASNGAYSGAGGSGIIIVEEYYQ